MNYLPRLKGKIKMKIIKEKEKDIIYLDEGEEILIKTLFKNNIGINIKCHNHSLFVDDVILKDLKNMSIEQKELKKLKEYNKNHNL